MRPGGEIHVCSLSKLEETIERVKPGHVLALAGPGKTIDRPACANEGFLTLEFNDINEAQEGLIAPNHSDVEAIIGFVREWNQKRPLLIFCWMGVSRSTAATVIALAALFPDLPAENIANEIRMRSPTATPNRLMIEYADLILERSNKLSKAIASIGRGEEAFEGIPFQFRLDEFSG